MKLVACGSPMFGLCASTEADPSSAFSKYLPNDLIWANDICVDSPKQATSSPTLASVDYKLDKAYCKMVIWQAAIIIK